MVRVATSRRDQRAAPQVTCPRPRGGAPRGALAAAGESDERVRPRCSVSGTWWVVGGAGAGEARVGIGSGGGGGGHEQKRVGKLT